MFLDEEEVEAGSEATEETPAMDSEEMPATEEAPAEAEAPMAE